MPWYFIDPPTSGRVIRTDWGLKVVEDLNFLYYRATGENFPALDLQFSLGLPLLRYKEVHGGQGMFTYGVRPADLPSLPNPVEEKRMKIVTIKGPPGESDRVYALLKGADDVLRWIEVAAG